MIHDRAVEILAGCPRGRLLDVPAGEGAFAARLVRAGFEVRCCDLFPEIFRVPGVEIRRGDLSGVLPYPDGSFEYVTCLEGLEHIENPHQAVREFRRVLRSGGHLLVSVPNILNVEERLKWLLFGYSSAFKPISDDHRRLLREQWHGEIQEVLLHINPIAYSELRYVLEKHGFQLVGTFRDGAKRRMWLYWPLVAVIRLIGRLTPPAKRRERWTEELQSEAVLTGGNTLVLLAVKA